MKIKKFLGTMLVVWLSLVAFTGIANATAVTVSCNNTNSPANQIYNNTGVGGTLLPAGRYVQLIQSTDNTAGAPNSSTGLPAGDTVISSGTLSAAGNFSGACNITQSNYIYIRAWDTWNGTGSPSGNYGTSIPSSVGSGFVYTYKPASFATTVNISSAVTPATLSGINPNNGTQEVSNLAVVLTGTNIQNGATAAFSGTGITINSTTINSATQATVNISIAASATTGDRTVSITNPGASASNAVTFTVNASGGVNHAPTANDVTTSTASNTSTTVNFSASDPDGNPLTYSIVSNPTHGSLGTVSGSQVTYTPTTGYTGSDSFTYRANDGTAYSNVATVNITVGGSTPPIPPTPGTSPVITNIYRSGSLATDPDRAKGPAGVRIIVEGTGFRDSTTSASRALEFTSLSTSALTEGVVLNWTDTTIEAILPAGLAAGLYAVDVKVSAPSAADPSVVTTFISTPVNFQVTASAAGDVAQIFPNPYNPLTEQVNIVVSNTGGASRLGYYIYDMAAQLVYKSTGSASQITWNGIDQWGQMVSNGAYLLRVVNEDTKSLLAKGKILVVKR
ncbi:MAG: cadherin-like domain-containing protein [Candidatus Margulisbacteria bacterium]|nr:cadherin-like domain-containing protein [Candidatus Margulisiibacteriota bacterium]